MNAMLGRDTGHKLQFSGGLADRLKKAAEKRHASGRRYQVPTVVGLNSPAVVPEGRRRQDSYRVAAGQSVPAPVEPAGPQPTRRRAVMRTTNAVAALPVSGATLKASMRNKGGEVLAQSALDQQDQVTPTGTGRVGLDALRTVAADTHAPGAAAQYTTTTLPEHVCEKPAFATSDVGSIAARWNSAAPPSFWSYPWQLSSMTVQLVSFVERAKPEQTPLERLSGAIERALVVATWSNGDVYEGEWSRGEEERIQKGPGDWVGVMPPLREQCPDGRGAHVFADGSVYIGQWKAGQRHGSGRMQQACGDCYTGQFKHDKFLLRP